MKPAKAWAVIENGVKRIDVAHVYSSRDGARWDRDSRGPIGLTIVRVEIREVKPKRKASK